MEQMTRIDNFLKYLVNLKKENPTLNMTKNAIYSQLVEVNHKLNNEKCHDALLNRYNAAKDINAFYSDQFGSSFLILSRGNINPENNIKLYLPFTPAKMPECCSALFDYLKDTNIIHQSKVARNVRNDDVVVRVNNFKDAQNIIDFVSHTPLLSTNLNTVNPFLFQEKGIGLAMDGNLSYNNEIAKLVTNYLGSLQISNKLETASAIGLEAYLKTALNTTSDKDLRSIYTMASLNFEPNPTIDNFKEKVDLLTMDSSLSREQEELLSSTRVKSLIDNGRLLQDAVMINYNKHGYDNTLYALKDYADTGNATGFTRTGNARYLIKNIPHKEIKKAIKDLSHFYYNNNTIVDDNNYARTYMDNLGLYKDKIK
jgi:hypothetical protein